MIISKEVHKFLWNMKKSLKLVQKYETRSSIYDKMRVVGNDEINKLIDQLEMLQINVGGYYVKDYFSKRR